MEEITSLDNPKIKRYAKLNQRKYREQEMLFIAEGAHIVKEALKHGDVVEVFTISEAYKGTRVSEKVMKKLSQLDTIPPVLAICRIPRYDEEFGERVVALDNVQDPGNVGTIIRSARALGFDAVIVKGNDAYSPKSVRATQGAIFRIPVVQVKHLSEQFGNHEVIGAVVDKEAMIYDEYIPSGPFVLVLGSEGSGITEENKLMLDQKVYIPIDFESINVAAAGAILMNQYRKK